MSRVKRSSCQGSLDIPTPSPGHPAVIAGIEGLTVGVVLGAREKNGMEWYSPAMTNEFVLSKTGKL